MATLKAVNRKTGKTILVVPKKRKTIELKKKYQPKNPRNVA